MESGAKKEECVAILQRICDRLGKHMNQLLIKLIVLKVKQRNRAVNEFYYRHIDIDWDCVIGAEVD